MPGPALASATARAGTAGARTLLDFDRVAGFQIAQDPVRPGDDLLSHFELAAGQDLDVGLPRDAGLHLAELRLPGGSEHEHAADLALLALGRVGLAGVLGRERVA